MKLLPWNPQLNALFKYGIIVISNKRKYGKHICGKTHLKGITWKKGSSQEGKISIATGYTS